MTYMIHAQNNYVTADTALLRCGRSEFESQLADLSWSHNPSLSPTAFPVLSTLSYQIKGKN